MRAAHCPCEPEQSEESISTPETALSAPDQIGSETEIIRSFLRVSGAYLFSCAYRDSLRAAYRTAFNEQWLNKGTTADSVAPERPSFPAVTEL